MDTQSRQMVQPPNDRFVVLPAHVFEKDLNAEFAICVFCRQPEETQTYEEYVAEWFATEYEGPQVDDDGRQIEYGPIPEDEWDYMNATCLKGFDDEELEAMQKAAEDPRAHWTDEMWASHNRHMRLPAENRSL